MTDIDKLRSDYEAAEAKAQKLMADKDEAIQKVRDRFTDRLRQATDEAAAAQDHLRNAEVHESLKDRSDRAAVVSKLRTSGEQALAGSLASRNTLPDGTLDVEAYEAGITALKDRAKRLGYDHLPFAEPTE